MALTVTTTLTAPVTSRQLKAFVDQLTDLLLQGVPEDALLDLPNTLVITINGTLAEIKKVTESKRAENR